MAARAILAFNLGELVRLGRLAIFSLYSLAYEAYQNSRECTYRSVQICEASSVDSSRQNALRSKLLPHSRRNRTQVHP